MLRGFALWGAAGVIWQGAGAAHGFAAGIGPGWAPEPGAKMSLQGKNHKQRCVWAVRRKKSELCGPNAYLSMKSTDGIYY